MLNTLRVPILYLILAVLILVSVVPLSLYSVKVVGINRDRLKTNEQLLQNTITGSLAEDLNQHLITLRTMMANLSSAVLVASGGSLTGQNVNTPELRPLLEQFASSADIAFVTILNDEAKGPLTWSCAPCVHRDEQGNPVLEDFLVREVRETAYGNARNGRPYRSEMPIVVGSGPDQRTILVVSSPLVTADGHFIGMIAAGVDLNFLIKRLQKDSTGGMVAYVVNRQGRLVAGTGHGYAAGLEMTQIDIVNRFKSTNGNAQVIETHEFTMATDSGPVQMLGTYSPVQSLGWAVIAQKPQSEAYQGVYEMQNTAYLLGIVLAVIVLVLGFFAARGITNPLEVLTQSSRAIAKGDFSQRVHLKSHTEIGELADTFNTMTSDLERFVHDLKRAAEENRTLFLSSIQMLAGAVDEKDPYTRGHSDRVTRYSVVLATEMALPQEEIEKIRISAQLHDVGKIGIEDRILKKPGALTPDEFEIMKTHTTKGATILRPVEMLREMLPGIELHHESLDGRGYPYGLKGDQIPLMPRIITVADTFDAMTTNRPYQAAMDPEYVVRIINSLANTKFDPRVIAALTAVFERGLLRLHRAGAVSGAQVAANASVPAAKPAPAAASAD